MNVVLAELTKLTIFVLKSMAVRLFKPTCALVVFTVIAIKEVIYVLQIIKLVNSSLYLIHASIYGLSTSD